MTRFLTAAFAALAFSLGIGFWVSAPASADDISQVLALKGELDGIEARLSQQAASLQAEEGSIKSQAESLRQRKVDLDREASSLESADHRLDSERNYLATRKQFAQTPGQVDQVNSLIDSYNQNLTQHKAAVQAFQQKQAAYNDLVSKLRAAIDRLSARYESHNGAVQDYQRRRSTLAQKVKTISTASSPSKPIPASALPSADPGKPAPRVTFVDDESNKKASPKR